MMPGKLRQVMAALLRRAGVLDSWERQDTDVNNVLRVLIYHRVAMPDVHPTFSPRALTATPQQFAWQMRYVAEHYNAISVDRLLDLKRRGHPLPPRTVLITLDDGARDFTKHAWPILQRFGLPALVFVPTAFPADPEARFWWDCLHTSVTHTEQQKLEIAELGEMSLASPGLRRRALRRLESYIHTLHPKHIDGFVNQVEQALEPATQVSRSTLNWDEIRQLCAQGLAVGNHTRHHALVDRLTEDECRVEIVTAQADLERELGHAWPVFCYPHGRVSPVAERVLGQERFELAFASVNGLNRWPPAFPLHLNRMGVRSDDSLDTFRLQLTTAYSRYKQVQHRARRIL